MVTSLNKEALQVAEAVAREKDIDPEEVLIAMEEAIQKLARTKYGVDNDIVARIDRKSGEITIERRLTVVEEASEESAKEILLSDKRVQEQNLKAGDVITESLPPFILDGLGHKRRAKSFQAVCAQLNVKSSMKNLKIKLVKLSVVL